MGAVSLKAAKEASKFGTLPRTVWVRIFLIFLICYFYFQRSRVSCDGGVLSPAVSEDCPTRRASSEVIIFFLKFIIFVIGLWRFWIRPAE